MKKFKSTLKLLILLSLLTCLQTPQTTKTKIPEVVGLYEIFEPDEIGIGQALLYSQWIENVWTYAPNNNLAKQVVREFWHKISEHSQFLPTEKPPVKCLTPEILGKLLHYIKNIEEEQETKQEIIQTWLEACNKGVKKLANATIIKTQKIKQKIENFKKKHSKTINKIETQIKNLGNLKNILGSNEAIVKLIKNKKFPQALKIKKALLKKKQSKAEPNADPEELKRESEILIKNLTERIYKLESLIKKEKYREKKEKLKKIEKKITNEYKNTKTNSYQKLKYLGVQKNIDQIAEPIAYLQEKIKKKIEEIIEKIENLASSKDFIPSTADAILWSYFESKSKFETKKDLDICLAEQGKEISDKLHKKNAVKKFEEEIDDLYINKKKINKIIGEYDLATYSIIKMAKTKIIPPEASQTEIPYIYKNQKTEPFPTCFESAILDTISILFYDPQEKLYSSSIENFQKLKQIFTEKSKIIVPKNINCIIQKWINAVSGLENINYKNKIDQKGYELKCSFENLIKVLNHFFNLELQIEEGSSEILKLDISNITEIQNPSTAKEFWNQLFSFLSNKFSTSKFFTKERRVTFSIENENFENNDFLLKDNIVETKNTLGIININIEYKNYDEYIDFTINIKSGHAFVNCTAREKLQVIKVDYDFTEHFYEKRNIKLIPIFLLSTDLSTEETTDIQIQQLLYYSLNLSDAQTKFEFIKKAFENNLVKNKKFVGLIENLIDKLPEDPNFTPAIIFYILNSEIKNLIRKYKKKITKCIDKYPIGCFLEIVHMKNIKNDEIITIAKKLLEKKEININMKLKDDYNKSPLHIAVNEGNKEIVELLLKHPKIDVNAQDSILNAAPLLYAIDEYKNKNEKEKFKEIIKLLLKHQKIDINLKTKYKRTALEYAIEEELIEIAKLLLEHPEIKINKKKLLKKAMLEETRKFLEEYFKQKAKK